MIELPKMSIITPSYNQGRFLERAIRSICNQGYANIEHIIIDGGSTDESLDIIRKYEKQVAYWISETDAGMYEAINKGIAKATGEFIGVLNGDDCYATKAFQTALEIFRSDPDADVTWGAADMIEKNSTGEERRAVLSPPREKESIVPYLLLEIPIFNACFFRRQVFERTGLLMEQLKIAGDREFMLRAALSGCTFHPTDTILYHYYIHDDSMTYGDSSNVFEKWNLEHCQIAQWYLGRKDTPGNARNAYRRMHTNSNLSLIKIAFKRRQFSIAGSLAIKGWRVDPLWPLIFLMRIPKIVRDSSPWSKVK